MSLRLSAGLAQRIVDRVSPVVDYNVNIMDPTGLIVAAVNQGRVGTMHEGARQAAESGTAVIVYEDDDARGVKQGVNLPFTDDGELLGVLGITGPPEQVETIAQLVVALVELIISSEARQGSAEVRAARDRDFLVRLVHDTHQLESGSLDAELERIPRPWQLTAFVPTRERGASAALAAGLQRLELAAGFERAAHFRLAQFLGALWVITTATETGERAEVLARTGQEGDWRRRFVRIATTACERVEDLAVQVRLLRALVEHPGFLPPGAVSVYAVDLSLEVALSKVQPELLSALAAPVLGLKPRLVRTLRTFIDSGGNVSETARLTELHRNSVTGQLARIAELSGFDAREHGQLRSLWVALVAARALSAER